MALKKLTDVQEAKAKAYFAAMKSNADALQDKIPLGLMSNAVLAQVVRGELDLNLLARVELLAGRGYDENGKWIGFQAGRERLIKGGK